MGNYLDIDMPLRSFTKEEYEQMIGRMKGNNLATNSINTYVRTLRTFLKWCIEEGYSDMLPPTFKAREVVKDTYTDAEITKLLKRPDKDCDFTEYRNWVIVQFLLNSGCRASTIRNIQNKDVDLENKQVIFRHTKTGKVQVIPLCSTMIVRLKEYIKVRKGNPDDFLFCNQYGDKLTENALKLAITRYNNKRGVSKTSIHMFRHTFARKYLLDCNGNAFTLQKLLGHSTLDMTKHYCAIYNADIARSFDSVSPLEQFNVQKIRK